MKNVKKWLYRANNLDNLLKSVAYSNISREERIEYITELKAVRTDVFRVVKKMKDCVSQCIIIEKYINNKSWEEIAEQLNYSAKWVQTGLHSKALKEVEEILNESKRNNRKEL